MQLVDLSLDITTGYLVDFAFCVKHDIFPNIKVLKNSCHDFQWIQIDKQHYGQKRKLYICVIYYLLVTFSYTLGLDYNILEGSEKEITMYKCIISQVVSYSLGLKCNDFAANDDNTYLPMYDIQYGVNKQIRNREIKDGKKDSRGKDLLDLCISQKMRMLNGRIFCENFEN